MTDMKASIEIKFEIHGESYEGDWYINYSPNDSGIDDRIVEWFSDCYEKASRVYLKNVDDYFKEKDKAENESREREELRRLKEKYDES